MLTGLSRAAGRCWLSRCATRPGARVHNPICNVRVTDHATVRWECPYRIPDAAPDAAALNLDDIVDIIAAVLAQQGA
jgi:hypothetical protein